MAKMFGLVGETLGHSFSPIIHRKIYECVGWQAEYGFFQVAPDNLKNLIFSLQTLGINGANVTIPYKQQVMPFLDEIAPEAEKIGAVNTIIFQDGKTIGDNTDYYGIVRTFEDLGVSLSGQKVVVLGNGGASKAVQTVLKDKGASIEIFSIEEDGNPDFSALPSLGTRDILVNATPVGMSPNGNDTPVSKEILEKFSFVFDLVYNPMPTRLVREARELGLVATTGLSMLVYQAVRSDELWFETAIPEECTRKVLEDIFALVSDEERPL